MGRARDMVLSRGSIRGTVPLLAAPREEDTVALARQRQKYGEPRNYVTGFTFREGRFVSPLRPSPRAVARRLLREGIERVMALYGIRRVSALHKLSRESGVDRRWIRHVTTTRCKFSPRMRTRCFSAIEALEARCPFEGIAAAYKHPQETKDACLGT